MKTGCQGSHPAKQTKRCTSVSDTYIYLQADLITSVYAKDLLLVGYTNISCAYLHI